MKHNILLTAFIALFAFIGLSVFNSGTAHADEPIYTTIFSDKAVQGYDTVTYFQGDGIPQKGSDDFKTQWRGATWLFTSQENLELFQANPEKYAPQYGGYCAWAAAHGTLAKGDANVYTVDNGKLYLNYDPSIHKKWEPRRAELISKANESYPDLVEIQ